MPPLPEKPLRALALSSHTITALMNVSVQLNYTSISVAIVLMEKLWGSVPTWSTSLLTSVVYVGSIIGERALYQSTDNPA